MLPGFLRIQSGPRIRVVGCTGMHAVGWPGAFLRRCRVSYSPCHERVREREREREKGEVTAGKERRNKKGWEKEPKEEGVEATSWALARPRTQLERVFLPFRGGNRVCTGRELPLSRDPFPATARHRRSLLPISRCRSCTGESLTSSSLLPKRKTHSVSLYSCKTHETLRKNIGNLRVIRWEM